MAVISNMEFVTNFLEGKNIGDCVGIKPNVSVVLDVSLHIVGGESSTISMNGHRVVGLVPHSRNELMVTE